MNGSSRQSAVYAVAQLCDGGEILGLEMQSPYKNMDPDGKCTLMEWLTFCVKYKDLPDTAQLGITVNSGSTDRTIHQDYFSYLKLPCQVLA